MQKHQLLIILGTGAAKSVADKIIIRRDERDEV